MDNKLKALLEAIREESSGSSEDRICFNCAFGEFPSGGSACPIMNSFICGLRHTGVSRYDKGCEYHLTDEEKNRLTKKQYEALARSAGG